MGTRQWRDGDDAASLHDSHAESGGNAGRRRVAPALFVEAVRRLLDSCRRKTRQSRCSRSIRKRRWWQSMPTVLRTAASRWCSTSGLPAPPPCKRKRKPGAVGWVTMDRAGRRQRLVPGAPGTTRRSPPRTSPPGRNRSATCLASGSKVPRHRTDLLRPNVTAAGVAMAKNKSGRPYWTLVLGAE